jgi:hypothetical protein
MGASEIAGMAAGGVAVLGVVLGVIWSQAVMWLRVQRLSAAAERYPPALLAEKVDTLWEYVVVGALERSRLVEQTSPYKVKAEALDLVTEELRGAVRGVMEKPDEHSSGRELNIGELAFRVQRQVGTEHLAGIARHARVSLDDVMGMVAALIQQEQEEAS